MTRIEDMITEVTPSSIDDFNRRLKNAIDIFIDNSEESLGTHNPYYEPDEDPDEEEYVIDSEEKNVIEAYYFLLFLQRYGLPKLNTYPPSICVLCCSIPLILETVESKSGVNSYLVYSGKCSRCKTTSTIKVE